MKIRDPDLNNTPVNQEHRQLGLPPVEVTINQVMSKQLRRLSVWLILMALCGILLYLMARYLLLDSGLAMDATVSESLFWSAVTVGCIAQVIDGALGMAYGITATTFLLTTGASPAIASASIHIAEIFTTGFSGISHLKLGNVNKRLFAQLLLPGICGALLGVVAVTQIDGNLIKPYISAYLLLMGIYILSKALRQLSIRTKKPKHVAKLALFGGFVDAAGGGGWGPVVTTTLLSSGNDPRTTIGSVNLAEFFLTIATAAAFSFLVQTDGWILVAGLVIGGLFAAPFAAVLCKYLHARTLLLLVGSLISALSAYNIYQAL